MDKWDIYERLNTEREFVIDENTGHVMRREAWERIDCLLDSLIEINRLEEDVAA
jgi:hypothetical protein